MVPVEHPLYAKCRAVVTNATTKQLRHRHAAMAADIRNFRFRNNVVYAEYSKTAQVLWPLVGKLCHISYITVKKLNFRLFER